MQEKIEILDTDLLKQEDKMKLIEYWAGILNYPMGWHYWLDFIWILNHLEQINLPRGSLIMDAGAGNGILQYILASEGYNIISLDFAERKIPLIPKRIFHIQEEKYSISNPGHQYKNFINCANSKNPLNKEIMQSLMRHPIRLIKNVLKYIIYDFSPTYINIIMWNEVMKAKIKPTLYGSLNYALGDFTNLEGFKDKSVDCIISVSALEHDEPIEIKKATVEFKRILKEGASMFLTLSAAREKDWYFYPCRGWCFCEETMRDIFGLENCISNFDKYDELFLKLKNSKELKKRIPIYSRYYLGTPNGGLPYGIYEPKYQPVGIVRQKSN